MWMSLMTFGVKIGLVPSTSRWSGPCSSALSSVFLAGAFLAGFALALADAFFGDFLSAILTSYRTSLRSLGSRLS